LVCPHDRRGLTFRDATSLLVRRPRRPLSRRSLQRPCLRVTGPPGYRLHPLDADRSAGASLEVSLASLRRSLVAPYRPELPTPGHPASALFPTSAPTPGGRFAHAVFSASRLRCYSQLRALETPPRGSFVADFFRPTYRIRAGCYRDLAGIVKIPATPMGFTQYPSQFCFRPRVTASFDVSHPPAVSPLAAASFIVAGSHRLWRCDRRFVAAAPGVWPRERTVPCDLAAPPWLLRTGPIEIQQPILPWAFHLFNEVCLRRSFLRYRQGTVTTT
jgi:hypothetical protein